jgi:hypothetical protein
VPDPTAADVARQVQSQRRRVQALQEIVFGVADPAARLDRFAELATAQARLDELERQPAAPAPAAAAPTPTAARGRLLGPNTTKLRVETTLNLRPLPTSIYHLLDADTDPLLTVLVENKDRKTHRVRVTAYLEGLSAQAVRTVELGYEQAETLRLLPTLLPEKVRAITEVQWATLHIIADDLDGAQESHNTFPVLCLAHTSSFNSVRRPDTGAVVDLSHYYGAWVTPRVEAVLHQVRKAAERLPDRALAGYQGDGDAVTRQVEALFYALKEADLTYVNSVIDYGAAPGQATQRTRLPREALDQRSANCIDGTVLVASLLEAASLHPALVLIPGHAFVAWEKWDGGGEWDYLETTLIGSADFAAACTSARTQFGEYNKFYRDRIKIHPLSQLRERGIFPME